jgi:hypothetical protein
VHAVSLAAKLNFMGDEAAYEDPGFSAVAYAMRSHAPYIIVVRSGLAD